MESNHLPSGYALTITFATPFGFVSWTIPSSSYLGCLPSSLYTFPAYAGLGSGLSATYVGETSPNLTEYHLGITP